MKDETIKAKRWISCPECKANMFFDTDSSIDQMVSDAEKVFSSVQKVPDASKLTVTFDA